MKLRNVTAADLTKVFNLYKSVAKEGRGIARRAEEITLPYLQKVYSNASKNGLMIVGEAADSEEIVCEIHGWKHSLKNFSHVFSNLTVVVHPSYQGQGYGKKLFSFFLNEIKNNRPDILRVELETRASNKRAIALFEELGFEEEGLVRCKIRNADNTMEDAKTYSWMNPYFEAETTALKEKLVLKNEEPVLKNGLLR